MGLLALRRPFVDERPQPALAQATPEGVAVDAEEARGVLEIAPFLQQCNGGAEVQLRAGASLTRRFINWMRENPALVGELARGSPSAPAFRDRSLDDGTTGDRGIVPQPLP